jgi:hypothetical protein
MEEIVVNIIHLPNDPKYPHREEREKSVIGQMEMEGCKYRFWPGIVEKERRFGINKAHRQIVQWAKDTNQKSVVIAEDDLLWYGKGAWKYYLDQMPEDYDIYLSSYYSGKANENNIIQSFSGLTLYSVHSRYFDKYLSIPEHMHIDTGISLIGGKIVVCDRFVTHQMKSFSEQRGRIADDSRRHVGKPIFGQ